MLLLCALVVGSSAWADTSTLTFTAACGGSGTADDGAKWTVTSDGTESTYDSTKGIHYGTNSGQVKYIQLSTSNISGTITKVVVNASVASGVSATVGVTIGGSAFGGDAKNLTSTAANYTFEGSASGEIVVKVEKPEKAAKAIYVKSIAVTYTSGGGSTPTCATPTFDPAEGTYTSAQNVTISTETQGATIYYTTDGSTPTTSSNLYSSAIPVSETTTIKAMAVKEDYNNSTVATANYTINLPYSGNGYVRVNSLDYLTDGAKVIIAARYDNNLATSYYAMTAASSGKPTGVSFTSETTSKGEELPAAILEDESTYYWTVGVTSDGYTLTNSNDEKLGCSSSSTNFATGGNNTAWTITRATSGSSAMVSGYEGFYIINKKEARGVALNNQNNYGAYATSNNNSDSYNFYLDIFVESVTPASDPSLSADDVDLEYDATSGSISYTLSNEPSPAGTLTAAITAGNEGSWLTVGTVSTTVPLTCAANNTTSARTATVTLTYTYGDSQTVTKNVTVTQAGNPDAYDNISDITAVGSTYKVKGTVVATNARGFVIGDGTGYVYTYLNSAPSKSVGDKVTINGTTGTYGHIIQFTSSATIAAATTSNYNNTPAVTAVDATAIAAYDSDYQLSDYVQLEGSLAKNSSNYEITVGTATVRISYPTTAQTTDLEALLNKDVRVKGYFAGFSSSIFTVMMESIEEIFIPKLSIDTTVDPFEYEENEEPSNEQIITVSGTNLTSDITVSVTGEYYLRSESDNDVSSLTLSSGDYFAVNLNDGLSEGSYPGTLTIASTGANSIVIELTGTVTPYVYPAITAETSVSVPAAGKSGTIDVTYTKIDDTTPDLRYFESTGTSELYDTDYSWITLSIDANNDISYTVQANTGEERKAYIKVYGQDNNGGDVFSELITITQSEYQPIGTLTNANIVEAGTGKSGYNNWTITDGKGKKWYTHAIKNQHSNATSDYHFLQIKKSTSSEASFIQVPDYGRKITSLKMTVSGSSQPMDGGSNSATLFFSSSNTTSASGEGIASGSGASSVTIDCSSLNLNTGYITAGGAVRIWDVEVTYEPLKLNSYGYATYASTNALYFTNADGYTAWQITAVTGDAITFSKITGAVAAGTGVLLMGTGGAEVTIINTESGETLSDNKLRAITTATNIPADTYYGLSDNTFKKIGAGIVPAGRAVLDADYVENSGGNARLTFVFEDVQGIKTIEHSPLTMDASVYNLSGQRVVTPKKGLYIMNGKKVLVK